LEVGARARFVDLHAARGGHGLLDGLGLERAGGGQAARGGLRAHLADRARAPLGRATRGGLVVPSSGSMAGLDQP
jgi:hypothetical protein